MTPLLAHTLLAETAAPAFLMSVAKPLLTLGALVPYMAIVSAKLEKDAEYFNLKPQRWAALFLGCGTAGLLSALMIPYWSAGFPIMLLLLVAPCLWYVRFRNKALAGTKAAPLSLIKLDFGKMAQARKAKSADAAATLRFQKRDRTQHPVPDRKEPAFETYVALESVLLPALDGRASRIDLALSKQGAQVQQVVDSVRYKRDPIGGELATRVVDMLKGFCGLDPAERRKYQRGGIALMRDGEKTNITVTTVGSMQGESIRIEIERDKQLSVPAASLGMSPAQAALRKSTMELQPTGGVVLLGARPGNGLTTLAYAMLGSHDAFTANIKTLERRVERTVEGVEHGEFDAGKAEYATQLQTIVRRGPDVVLASELTEPGVGPVVAAPNARSIIFYCAMPSDNPAELMQAWMKAAGDPGNAAQALKMVLTQRLLRKLCPTCRVGGAPSAGEAKMLAIPAGKTVEIFRQSGRVLVKEQPVDCPTCRGTGYLGVTGAFEVLPIDAEARKLLAAGDIKGAYLQARRASKSPSLQDSALAKVRAGETSFDEVKRVFAPAAAPAPAAAAAKPAAPATPPKK